MAVKKENKHAAVAVLLTYLLLSFMPQLGLMQLLGKKPPKSQGY